ncbi:hypothetical protein [Caballeronia sp. LZ034LL]|uniref:hypothetical protein n=1 Tax=Caballeronia sp. LZ034LL TaxID=3038567 RepID=UPI0028612D48|nr:hypothetical protein [Caballeronia sp. LZ034LL]MDR5839343.1 hypothetical protein [Caballeronia sp. LZ034LL]
MKQLYAPNGKLILGTYDKVPCCCNTSGWSDLGDPIFSGGSDMYWDDSTTQLTPEGEMLVVDEDGDIWAKNLCTLR